MGSQAQDDNGRASRWAWLNPLAAGLGRGRRTLRFIWLALALWLLAAPLVMWHEYNRAFPPFLDPRPQPGASGDAGAAPAPPPKGAIYADTLITMGERMLRAWLPNDALWPSILLDNPQNFQLGELEVMRYATRVLRDKLSRQRTTDKIDADADRAFTDFSNNPRAWIFPSAETKFSDGVNSLRRYRQTLNQGGAAFYPRADNLIELLDQLSSLLGGVDTRLGNAPRDWTVRMSEETAGDRYSEGETAYRVSVPWTQIDDNFYFARGVAYGIRQVLAAVRWEFAEILRLKRSLELLDNIVAELALAQFEPLVVLNGDRDSIFANHSLSLMATLEDVRQKMISLQQMLER